MANKNKDMENLGKVLDAWKQQKQNLKTENGVNASGHINSMWVDNWRIIADEPCKWPSGRIFKQDYLITYKGKKVIKVEPDYNVKYTAKDELLQDSGLNIGDVLQFVSEKFKTPCAQIDPTVFPHLSEDEFAAKLNKEWRKKNKNLEEVDYHEYVNVKNAKYEFTGFSDEIKDRNSLEEIRNAFESEKPEENIVGTLLQKYAKGYFDFEYKYYEKNVVPKKHYIPSNFVEQNKEKVRGEKSVKPQQQKKEIKRSRSRESIER